MWLSSLNKQLFQESVTILIVIIYIMDKQGSLDLCYHSVLSLFVYSTIYYIFLCNHISI